MSDLKNLDLESLEALLEQKQTTDKHDRDRSSDRHSKKKKHRSRSRSRSQKKKSRKRSRSRSRSSKRDKDSKHKRRSKSRSRDGHKRDRDKSKRKSQERDKARDEKADSGKDTAPANGTTHNDDDNIDLETIDRRQKERQQKEEEERKKREEKQFEEKINEAKKQLEEARRDDSTVMILNLSIKSLEREIYEFFLKHNCGRIRDIRVIKDPRSGKSKGVCYVEFYSLESVNKAIALSGQELQGSKIRVLPSKAEINRTAAAAKQLKQNKGPGDQHQQATGAMRVYVSGLTDQLADIEEKDLADLFGPFGEVDKVEIHRDDVTGKSKGYAFVLFRNSADAKRAIIEMDGFTVNGKKIKVQPIQAGQAHMMQDASSFDLDDESGNNYLQTAQSRALLMQKLQRDNSQAGLIPGMEPGGVGGTAMGQPPVSQPIPAPKAQTSLLPTNCILMSNMFNSNEVDLVQDPAFYVDLREEIEDECRKYGDVEKAFVEVGPEGHVWIRFKEGRGASIAYQTLNNKFFSGRKIVCNYVTENTFNSKLRSM